MEFVKLTNALTAMWVAGKILYITATRAYTVFWSGSDAVKLALGDYTIYEFYTFQMSANTSGIIHQSSGLCVLHGIGKSDPDQIIRFPFIASMQRNIISRSKK